MNVPTYYALKNNQVLKPKSQVAVNGTSTGTEVDGVNGNVIQSIENESIDERQYTSIGNGEFLTLFWNNDALLRKWDVKGNFLGSIEIAPAGIGTQDTIDNFKLIEYIGQPFLSDSDTDRYAIITAYDTNWKVCLLNLETMTIQKRWDGDVTPYVDFTYDGEYTIYFIYQGNNDIYSKDIRGATGGSITPLKDQNDNRIPSETLYGLTPNGTGGEVALLFKGIDNIFKKYKINAKQLSQFFYEATNVLGVDKVGIVGRVDGTIYYRPNLSEGTDNIDLTPSLVAAGSIFAGELNLIPTTINNFVETETEFKITWTLMRNDNDQLQIQITTITKADNSSVSILQGLISLYGEVKSTNFIRNQINNVKNGYYYDGTISKFYKYGLQVQSDSV